MSTQCWTTSNKISPNGYSRVMGKIGHRVFYESFKGKIKEGYTIDHLCREKSCVNPDHLEAVTQRENSFRAPNYVGNRKECPKGHEYTGENIVHYNGRRICRICKNTRQREYALKKGIVKKPRGIII